MFPFMSVQPNLPSKTSGGVPKLTCQNGSEALASFASNAYTLLFTVVTKTKSWVPPRNVDIGHIQRLAVNLIVDNSPKQHPKLLYVHFGWGQDDLIQVGSGALVVVMLRQHAHLDADRRPVAPRQQKAKQETQSKRVRRE